MSKREAVARAVWDTLGADYTYEEAVNGSERETHAQAVSWVREIADVALRAISTFDEEAAAHGD